MIEKERILPLNQKSPRSRSDYVIYWMQASQRISFNHALCYACELANARSIPLLIFFQLLPDFPDANRRHYQFMLEGLTEIQKECQDRNITFLVRLDDYRENKTLLSLSKKAYAIITDRGYLRFQKFWRNLVSKQIDCPLIQVESDIVVPVETTSSKEEYAARTIRPKIQRKLELFLKPILIDEVKKSSSFPSTQLNEIKEMIDSIRFDSSVSISTTFQGGYANAKRLLNQFLEEKIQFYHEKSNDPVANNLSQLSPYLHFGQISPLEIALKVLFQKESYAEKFLEQLIIRRELAINFVHYNSNYDSILCLPEWCQKTLQKHKQDTREYNYSLAEFEKAQTHDEYWNAAQMEMINTGKMHGYMRMYWGKKVMEWTADSETAYKILLKLNNKYELDGRDPNGFAGIAWCFGKHDQGWKERPIFGKIRYMNQNGLKRKFDIQKYVERIDNLKSK